MKHQADTLPALDSPRTAEGAGHSSGEAPSSDINDLLRCSYRFALALSHDRSRAEDLVQDAWISVLRAQGPWTKEYLFSVVRNRFIDQHRRARLVNTEILEEHTEISIDSERYFWCDEVPASSGNTSLDRALSRLRPEEREVMFLTAVEGYTAKEVADMLGSARGTVLSMMHRARKKLRRWLEPTKGEG